MYDTFHGFAAEMRRIRQLNRRRHWMRVAFGTVFAAGAMISLWVIIWLTFALGSG